jgi:uncharacterized protein DUF6851/vanadium-dependent haloperoxidase-like protein
MKARVGKFVGSLVLFCCVAGAASGAETVMAAPGVTAAPPGAAPGTTDSVVLQWNDALLQAIRDTQPGPPICARMLAIVATCMYDAWAAYDPLAIGTRLGGSLRRPAAEQTMANKEKAISFAAYRALVDLFPQPDQGPKFTDMMRRLGYDPTDLSTDTRMPSGIGNVAAGAVLEFRHHDGANQLGDLNPGAYSDYTGYAPVNTPDQINDPNRWQPLRISDGRGGFVIQKYVGPHWGRVIPFALSSGAEFRPTVDLPRYGTPEYEKQAREILDDSANLTDEQKTIVEYWADGPGTEQPPGHWCLFAQYVSRRDHFDVDADVKLLFTLTNALMDAGIAAWDAKRVYDSARPITAIHYLSKGQKVRAWGGPYQGTQEIDGADWKPYQVSTFVTPAFPEYFSGHSTFSAAGAEVLKSFTGSDAFGLSVTKPAGSSLAEPGLVPAADVTLSWATFSDAADQTGLSGRYGGIQFADGDLMGRKLGRLVGLLVWDKALTYFLGGRWRSR